MAVSDDGSSIFLTTNTGIRWFRLSVNPTFGSALTFEADLSANGSSLCAPTGSVSFIDSETNQALGEGILEDGRATLTLSNVHAGAHSILARYSGDANYNPADSSTVPLNIQRARPTLSITSL